MALLYCCFVNSEAMLSCFRTAFRWPCCSSTVVRLALVYALIAVCESHERAIDFRFGGGLGEVVESRFDRPCIQGAGHLHWGRHALACNLYITFVIVTQFSPNILRNAISPRCRSDVFWHPRCSWATTGLSFLMQELTVMKNEKLKPTTVRFTDSDLHLIDCLQKKLGLRMIHIIRLAIRRLAENENLLPSNSAVKKR